MVLTYASIPYAHTSDSLVCFPALTDSFECVSSSMAIHRVDPFPNPVVVIEGEEAIILDIPKSANNGSPESEIKTLS